MDTRTRHAIQHTLHCLIGCGIGEILGMLLASSFGWHKLGRLSLAIVLAFVFGYGFTYRGIRKQSKSSLGAFKSTLATDTVSIVTMEVVDNVLEFLIPNALAVTASSFRFWWGLGVSLAVAFVVTVPVNRLAMSRNRSH